MNDLAESENVLPLVFPNPRSEAAARAREFREMSHEQRMRAMRTVLKTGTNLVNASPKRAVVDAIFQKREDAWQRIQRELFSHAQ